MSAGIQLPPAPPPPDGSRKPVVPQPGRDQGNTPPQPRDEPLSH